MMPLRKIFDLQLCPWSQAGNHLGEDQSKDMDHAIEINDLRPKSQRIRGNLRFEESQVAEEIESPLGPADEGLVRVLFEA